MIPAGLRLAQCASPWCNRLLAISSRGRNRRTCSASCRTRMYRLSMTPEEAHWGSKRPRPTERRGVTI